MWVIEVDGEEFSSRKRTLVPGEFSVGSSRESAIFLPDGGVQDLHFNLTLTESSASVSFQHEATVYVDIDSTAITADKGDELSILAGGRVHFGSVKMSIMRESSDSGESDKPRSFPRGTYKRKVARQASLVLFVALATTVFGYQVSQVGATDRRSLAMSSDGLPPEATVTPDFTEERTFLEDVQITLRRTGFDHFDTRLENGNEHLTLYFKSLDQQSEILDLLGVSSETQGIDAVVDSGLVNAANLFVSSMDLPVEVRNVEHGRILLAQVGRTNLSKSYILEKLRQDVPQIRSAAFDNSEDRGSAVDHSDIAGVWFGNEPFVVLVTGEILSRGSIVGDRWIVKSIDHDGSLELVEDRTGGS